MRTVPHGSLLLCPAILIEVFWGMWYTIFIQDGKLRHGYSHDTASAKGVLKMEFKELVSPSLTDLFIKELQRMILSGELKIGERLPTERELSEKMKVSRAVVNGGLNQLADMGFIRIAPRKGAFVNDYVAKGDIQVLTAIMAYNGWKFTPEYLEPMLQIRKSIEPFFMELAAQHPDSSYLSKIPEIIAALKELPTPQAAGELIFDFYHTAALASGNIILPLLLRTFMSVYQSMGSVIAQLGYLDDQIRECESIYQAIIHGQAQDARDYDIKSIESCRNWIGSHYKPGEHFYPSETHLETCSQGNSR